MEPHPYQRLVNPLIVDSLARELEDGIYRTVHPMFGIIQGNYDTKLLNGKEIPLEIKVFLIDGQHRMFALRKYCEKNNCLEEEGYWSVYILDPGAWCLKYLFN